MRQGQGGGTSTPQAEERVQAAGPAARRRVQWWRVGRGGVWACRLARLGALDDVEKLVEVYMLVAVGVRLAHERGELAALDLVRVRVRVRLGLGFRV